MTGFHVKPLDPASWPAFADLVERHNGVWGGCWCLGFHPKAPPGTTGTLALNKAEKLRRVRAGETHSALVFDGDACVGWCQFGSPAELPRIKSAKAYAEGLADLPDWRITCFFVDKAHRRAGVADAALGGAVDQIARAGGGIVESYPEDAADRKVSSAFLHNATLALFERHGFIRDRRIGKNRWVVRRTVAAEA